MVPRHGSAGYPRPYGAGCDIGAVESWLPIQFLPHQRLHTSSNGITVMSGAISLRFNRMELIVCPGFVGGIGRCSQMCGCHLRAQQPCRKYAAGRNGRGLLLLSLERADDPPRSNNTMQVLFAGNQANIPCADVFESLNMVPFATNT